jgi:hypothetical protein
LNCCSTLLRAATASSRAADTCTAAAKHKSVSQTAVRNSMTPCSTLARCATRCHPISVAHGTRAHALQHKGHPRPHTCC